MKKILLLLVVIATLGMGGCTENIRTKMFGGSMEIQVPKGNKVTNITWKGEDLWYSYRPFEEGEEPTETTFHENSSLGVMEGTVTFIESK